MEDIAADAEAGLADRRQAPARDLPRPGSEVECPEGRGFVVARELFNSDVEVTVFTLAPAGEYAGDAKLNLDILDKLGVDVREAFDAEGAPAEDVPPGWRPSFVDYLFLGYSTATAFSTTDVMPLTSRAKLLMMFESAISLATILVVAARAINILGG
jgi:hypothetical protein